MPGEKSGKQYLEELQDAASERNHQRRHAQRAPNGISDEFFGNFGKPGGGAPRVIVNRTQKLQERFNTDKVVNDNITTAFGQGCGNPKINGDFEPNNYKQKMMMPKEEDMSKVGERAHPPGVPKGGKLPLLKIA